MNIRPRTECLAGYHVFEPLITFKRGSSKEVAEFYCKHCLESVTSTERQVYLMALDKTEKKADPKSKPKTKQPAARNQSPDAA